MNDLLVKDNGLAVKNNGLVVGPCAECCGGGCVPLSITGEIRGRFIRSSSDPAAGFQGTYPFNLPRTTSPTPYPGLGSISPGLAGFPPGHAPIPQLDGQYISTTTPFPAFNSSGNALYGYKPSNFVTWFNIGRGGRFRSLSMHRWTVAPGIDFKFDKHFHYATDPGAVPFPEWSMAITPTTAAGYTFTAVPGTVTLGPIVGVRRTWAEGSNWVFVNRLPAGPSLPNPGPFFYELRAEIDYFRYELCASGGGDSGPTGDPSDLDAALSHDAMMRMGQPCRGCGG